MYRTVKLLYGCANVFVLYPLIIYVLSTTTLLLAAEGAEAPPPHSDIKEAEKIVGRFLRNEAGTTWLSGLAKSRSAPLTTQDLMTEIIAATRPGGKVWKAASILSETLKNETLKGMVTDSIMGQPENWKDLIEHIENEKDIICLYRKNNEQAAEKENDWKTFLRTVSPGYTVHLAIDTGNKYVICLKKIEVSENSSENIVTTDEIMTTEEMIITEANSSTVNTSADPTLIETETIFPITSENQENLVHQKSLTTSNAIGQNNSSDKNCSDGNQASGKVENGAENSSNIDLRNEDILETIDNLGLPEEKQFMSPETDNSFNAEFENGSKTGCSSISPSMKKKVSDLGNNGRPFVNSYLGTPDRLDYLSHKNHECNRPIIVVMQNDNIPGYRPWIPLRIHQNPRAPKFPRFPFKSVPFRTMSPQLPSDLHHPTDSSMALQLPSDLHHPTDSSMSPQLPSDLHHPTDSSKISRPPFNPLMQSNIIPSWSKLNNRNQIVDQNQKMYIANPRPIVSQNPNFLYKIPRGKIQRPIVQSYPKSIVKPVKKSNMMPITKPIMQTARNNFVPQSEDMKSRASNPNLIQNLRSPFGNYMPRRNEGWSGPRIPYSHMHRPTKFTPWYVPSRNIVLPQSNTPVKSNLIDNKLLPQLAQAKNSYSYRQPLENYKNNHLLPRPPIFESRLPIMRKPVQSQIIKPYSFPTNMKHFGRPSPMTPSKFVGRPLSSPSRVINRNNSPFSNILPQNPPKQKIYQNPVSNLNPKYPMRNKFGQSNVRTPIATPLFTHPCSIPWSNFYAIGKNNPTSIKCLPQPLGMCSNPLVCTQNGNQLERSSKHCPSPCDRPVKLKIFINGQIQEPLNVSVISESGQHVEIVGSGKPIISYGGRALKEGTSLFDHVEDDEEKVVDKVEQKQEEQENTTDETVSSEGSTSDQSEKLDEENNPTTEFTPETTPVGLEPETSGEPEIEERILNEVRTETSSIDSTVEANTTVPSIINSTMIEY